MGQGALHVNAMPKIRQVLQNTTPRVYMQMCNIGTPSSRPFLSLINFASTKSILFPDEICLKFSIKYAKYFLDYILPRQRLYDCTPGCQTFLKSMMNIFSVLPCTWNAPRDYIECGLLLEVITYQTWYILLSSAPCASRAHYTSQLLVIVTGGSGHCPQA